MVSPSTRNSAAQGQTHDLASFERVQPFPRVRRRLASPLEAIIEPVVVPASKRRRDVEEPKAAEDLNEKKGGVLGGLKT
jgi:hypothetical protein